MYEQKPISKFDMTMASYQYKIIKEEIEAFESQLDSNSEIALRLCNFGQSILLNVDNINYEGAYLMVFYGSVNGQPARLIQHVSQLNFLLTSVPKANPEKPPKRIAGFLKDS